MRKLHLIIDFDDSLFDTHNTRKPYPGVIETLEQISSIHALSLVTIGKHKFDQWQKLLSAGLLQHFSTVMIVPGPEEKAQAFEAVTMLYPDILETDTIVVGDRINREITFGNRMGLVTVQLLQGKHAALQPTHPDEEAKYKINSFPELISILRKLEVHH